MSKSGQAIAFLVAQVIVIALVVSVMRRPEQRKGRHIIIYLSEFARVQRVEDNSGFRIVGIEGLRIITANGGALRTLTNRPAQ